MGKKAKKETLFSIQNIGFSYSLGSVNVRALSELSLDIPGGTLVTFSGPSGSGKSTLLNILGLIEPMQEGQVCFQGEDFSCMSKKRRNEIRKLKIGFIFQQFHLIPVLTTEENVEYFLKRQNLSKEEVKKRTREALEAVGLWKHKNKKPSQLSGGQKQRVAIARAIAKKPEVIIADEPTASLDQKTGREIMEIFDQMVKERKVSIIISTHDPMVLSFAKENYHIMDGHLVEEESS